MVTKPESAAESQILPKLEWFIKMITQTQRVYIESLFMYT